jgi:hypothetical protein
LTSIEPSRFDDRPAMLLAGVRRQHSFAGMAERVPAQHYAVFEHRGPVATIGATWNAIWSEWLPRSGRTVADTPDFEVYDALRSPDLVRRRGDLDPDGEGLSPSPSHASFRLPQPHRRGAVPVFVHLTSHRNIPAIRRGGIAPGKARGVYALPVTRNFYVSHQWLRELKRSGGGTIFGVYFRIPDDERVEVGHYNSRVVTVTAAEAAALMLAAEQRDPVAARAVDKHSRAVQRGRALPSSPEGYEVVIPRRIAPSEIIRVKALPQVVGWRYMPRANGTPPCACVCCQRGQYGIRRLERAVEEAEAGGKPTRAVLFGREERSFRRVERLRARRGHRN